MLTTNKARVAVVGAGIAGAACARALRRGGFDVHVFDKSRGPGGRLATRRLEWVDRRAQPQTTRLDHGAFALTAHSAAFQAFVDEAVTAGWMSAWAPAMAAGSSPLACGGPLFVPVPDMPSLCRRLLEGVQCTWSFAVDSLQKGPSGWFVQAGDDRHPEPFDAVLLALPPAQAAPLLGPHHTDWARHASVVPMQPCWTLMGIAHAPPQTAEAAPAWDLAQPPTGPLAWVIRNDARPGRPRVAGQAHWVLHARAGFSRQHLEEPAAWVQQQMQAALAEWLGQPVDWHYSVVHRWRYAMPTNQAHTPAREQPCWWDAAQGLGVCGDFLGGMGVEGAWLSGQALASALCAPFQADVPAASTVPATLPRLAA